METLHLFGTPEQRTRWLEPLLCGQIRSAFAMTEPDVASSDATNITTQIVRDGDDYVINGRKWWISGAADERCQVFIVMGKTDPTADTYRQQSMILVSRDAPGVSIERQLPVFGYQDQHGHSEIVFRNVRVPASNMLAAEGDGFMIAQARLGPGRIHHAMRAIGMAERALGLMVDRAKSRVAFGKHLSDQGVVQELIAQSRIDIDQARLLVYKTAWLIDNFGAKGARTEIAATLIAAISVRAPLAPKLSISHAVLYTSNRAWSMSIRDCAISSCTTPWSDRCLPNATRDFARSTISPRARSAIPIARIAWWIRPGPSRAWAIMNPSPCAAIMFDAGTRTLRNTICLLYTSDAADDLTRVDLGGRR